MLATDFYTELDSDDEDPYRHPFTVQDSVDYYTSDEEGYYETDDPRTLIELRMCALSAAIREKPEWYTKSRDTKIQEKWRQEIQEQQKDIHDSLKLTPNMVCGGSRISEVDVSGQYVGQLRDGRTGGVC
jgi:hypothetical protein